MNKQYHILNGDALKEQFPKNIEGEIIVARECLVTGDVSGDSLAALFQTRAKYISSQYEYCSEEDYYQETVSEFYRMQEIPEQAIINLWFEDDLFCQVNCWFVLYLLKEAGKNNPIYLIRPAVHTHYGFGGLDTHVLTTAYENRILLTELEELTKLWKYYQSNDLKQLLAVATSLQAIYPFIINAVQAHIDRIPTEESLGQPSESLLEIMEALNTEEFGPIFQEFNRKESIYGFGDTQVKHLFDALKK